MPAKILELAVRTCVALLRCYVAAILRCILAGGAFLFLSVHLVLALRRRSVAAHQQAAAVVERKTATMRGRTSTSRAGESWMPKLRHVRSVATLLAGQQC